MAEIIWAWSTSTMITMVGSGCRNLSNTTWYSMITYDYNIRLHRYAQIEVSERLRWLPASSQTVWQFAQTRWRKSIWTYLNNQGSLNREKYDDSQIHAFDIGWSWLNPPKQNCSLHALRRSEELRVEILGTNLLPQVQVNAQSLPKSETEVMFRFFLETSERAKKLRFLESDFVDKAWNHNDLNALPLSMSWFCKCSKPCSSRRQWNCPGLWVTKNIVRSQDRPLPLSQTSISSDLTQLEDAPSAYGHKCHNLESPTESSWTCRTSPLPTFACTAMSLVPMMGIISFLMIAWNCSFLLTGHFCKRWIWGT